MREKSIRLKYMSAKGVRNSEREADAQPCVVEPNGVKPFRVVPVAPFIGDGLKSLACLGCVGHHGSEDGNDIDCSLLPDCTNTIYVRATPANKVKHIAWLLDQH
jgi:hypothetical protein